MEQCVVFYLHQDVDGAEWVADTHVHNIPWSDVQWALDNTPGVMVSVTKVKETLFNCHREEVS